MRLWRAGPGCWTRTSDHPVMSGALCLAELTRKAERGRCAPSRRRTVPDDAGRHRLTVDAPPGPQGCPGVSATSTCVPRRGVEPRTRRLRVACSTTELARQDRPGCPGPVGAREGRLAVGSGVPAWRSRSCGALTDERRSGLWAERRGRSVGTTGLEPVMPEGGGATTRCDSRYATSPGSHRAGVGRASVSRTPGMRDRSALALRRRFDELRATAWLPLPVPRASSLPRRRRVPHEGACELGCGSVANDVAPDTEASGASRSSRSLCSSQRHPRAARALHGAGHRALAGIAGLEPAASGFGDRRSSI